MHDLFVRQNLNVVLYFNFSLSNAIIKIYFRRHDARQQKKHRHTKEYSGQSKKEMNGKLKRSYGEKRKKNLAVISCQKKRAYLN